VNTNEKKTSNSQISSKIKPIFLRLYDYYFFHGISDVNKMGVRFIGRKKIIDNLKTIISFSGSQSGAYLITGYRGMGKSSYLEKVIDSLDFSKIKNKAFTNFLRIFAIATMLNLFDTPQFLFTLTIIAFISHFGFAIKKIRDCKNSDRSELYKKTSTVIYEFLRLIFSFDPENTIHSDATSKRFLSTLLKSFYIATLSRLLSSWLEINFILLILLLTASWTSLSRVTIDKNLFKHPITTSIKAIQVISNFFKYSRKICIKISLGHEELKEIDVLKLISKSIEREFIKFRGFSLRNFYIKCLKMLFIFLITYGMFYNSGKMFIKLNESLMDMTQFTSYFPSQEKGLFSLSPKVSISPEKILLNHVALIDSITPVNKIALITIYFDTIVVYLYQRTLSALPFPLKKTHRSTNFPYLFLFYFSAFWFFFYLFLPKLFNITTDRIILKKIKKLNRDIEFDFEENTGTETVNNKYFNIKISKNTKLARKKADVKEIENRISDILQLCSEINIFSLKPEFIFIFDELDKVGSDNTNFDQSSGYDKNFSITESYFGNAGFKKKQTSVFKILFNLKHFITSSKAKYIFIAGRELYDAALADTSDRNFFIGSIFDKSNIYVESFLSEGISEGQSITSLTEKYVCQFLFPGPYLKKIKEPTLFEYRRFLLTIYKPGENNADENVIDEEINKIINTLRNFILFLTYRSSGAPKKISSLFEEYITLGLKRQKYAHSIQIDYSYNQLHLLFNENTQYLFGLYSYLITPVYLSITEKFKELNDKLLVSITFLVDHLYKFHKNAFSWSDIEITPELLDINKSPQLRDLVQTLLQKLSNNHLLRLNSGLFEFKYIKKISEEICSISKSSESESAAFNFTLDESQALKDYFLGKLNNALSNHNNETKENEFKNSIYSIHMALGDIHFFDNDFNTSIRHYYEAIKFLNRAYYSSEIKPKFSFLQNYIKTMLKVGLLHEKQNENDKASSIYSEIVSKIIEYRNINLVSFSLEPKRIDKTILKKAIKRALIPPNTNRLDYKKKEATVLVENKDNYSNYLLEYRSVDSEDKIICLEEDFHKLMYKNPFNVEKYEVLLSIQSVEGSNLIHQSLLAKLHMIEKTHFEGITKVDIQRVEQEYNFITKTIDYRNKYISYVDFWSKVGDLLYYKNGFTNSIDNRKISSCGNCNGEFTSACTQFSACSYYQNGFKRICYDFLNIKWEKYQNKNNYLSVFYESIIKYQKKATDNIVLSLCGNTLAGIGNTCYSTSTKNDITSLWLNEFFNVFSNLKKKNPNTLLPILKKKTKKIERAILCFLISSELFEFSGNYKEANMQLTKIMYIIKNLITMNKKSINKVILNKVNVMKNAIVSTIIRNFYLSNNNIHRIEIDDIKKYSFYEYNKKEIPANYLSNAVLKDTTLSADIREIVLIINEIEMRLNWNDYIKTYNDYLKKTPLNSNSIINSRYRLMLELKQKLILNFKILKTIIEKESFDPTNNNDIKIFKKFIQSLLIPNNLSDVSKSYFEKYFNITINNETHYESIALVLKRLAIDSLYCCEKIIRIANVYEFSYLSHHTLIAYIYYWKAGWSQIFFSFESPELNLHNHTDFFEYQENELGILSLTYLYEKSIEHFLACESIHKGGKMYKEMINNMFFLNDDYGDTLNFFHIASERYRMNNNDSIVTKIEKYVSNSSIYKHDSHC